MEDIVNITAYFQNLSWILGYRLVWQCEFFIWIEAVFPILLAKDFYVLRSFIALQRSMNISRTVVVYDKEADMSAVAEIEVVDRWKIAMENVQ